jgi:transcriptional regulator with XRE-family HTH domain
MRKTTTAPTQPTISYARLVGRIIEETRKQAKLTQIDMADALGVSQSAYSRLELGQTAMSVTQLRIIADKLRTTPQNVLQCATQYGNQLRAHGVTITDEKSSSAASVLIALGFLAAIIAAASS